MARAGFVLDLGRCLGCSACVLACRLENAHRWSLPVRRVLPLNGTRHAGGPTWFLSVACHHCERPACVRACPSAAYERRADGVVTHDEALCIGCRYCEMVCPFGAPQFDTAKGVMAKCDFCEARVAKGDPPACVVACPTEALRGSEGELSPDPIPGFVDPAACRPAIRFKLPRGGRGYRLQHLIAQQAGLKRPETRDRGLQTGDEGPETRDPRPETRDNEWPLVVFTALAIPAAGVFAARLLAGLVSGPAMPGDGVQALAAIALFVGLAVSLLHLGRPLRAPLALRGAGRSALATEVALASAVLIVALLALLPALSPALRLASARAAGIMALGLLVALGLVYFLPARRPWRTVLVATPMTSGLAIGVMVLASTAAPWRLGAALGLLAVDIVAFVATWLSWRAGGPTAPIHAGIFAWRRPLVALRVVMVNLLPATLLLAQLPILAVSVASAGVFVDRFAFYGLASERSTEAAIAEVDRFIARH
jgi:formate dehydrogenase iron-sulfur subunit